MNALIEVLESLAGSMLPWLLLALAVASALLFAYLAFVRGSSSLATRNMRSNSSSDQFAAMRTIADLQTKWEGKRNYVDTLRKGPNPQDEFKGWFEDEKKLCNQFWTEKDRLIKEQELRIKEYPEAQRRYLAIVNESERNPHSTWIYIGLLLLMGIEATGFSLIFADRLTDTASARAVEQYAIGIAIVIAAFALYFAHRVGVAVYRQGYARTAHLHAPGNSLTRTPDNEGLQLSQEEVDAHLPQSIRIINRSNYVHEAAGEAKRSNKLIPRFPIKLWIYVAVVVIFGTFVAFVRLGQIEEFYAKQAQQQAAIAASDSSPETNLSVPPGVMKSKQEAAEVITQEVLDKEKRGKQLAILVFIAIFFIAQTLGVVLAASRGFASNDGEKAFKGIRAFHELHGDISLEQWKLKLEADIDSADRYAQESLTGWQLGLQTAFTNKAMPVPNEAFFAQCAGDFSHRTYGAYVQLLEHAKSATKRGTAAMPQFAPQPATVGGPIGEVEASAAPTNASSLAASGVPVGTQQQSPSVEYFITSSTGDESVETCSLAQLKQRILVGELSNLALLNVRLAGQPGRFVRWAEFAKREFEV